MKSLLFMNHHLRDRKSREPVITIQTGSQRIYVNRVRIKGEIEVRTGLLPEVKDHEVRAWLEISGQIEVLE